MCKDPCIPKVDHLQEIGTAIASGVATVGRTAVRLGCRWFSDEQLGHGRRILCWQVPIWLLACAALTWWLGRPAALVFAGVVIVSWVLGHALRAEVSHRAERAQLARMRARYAKGRVRRQPVAPQPAPAPEPEVQTLEDELAGLVAAHHASEEDR